MHEILIIAQCPRMIMGLFLLLPPFSQWGPLFFLSLTPGGGRKREEPKAKAAAAAATDPSSSATARKKRRRGESAAHCGVTLGEREEEDYISVV